MVRRENTSLLAQMIAEPEAAGSAAG
jgi:hypothetical protein